MIEPAHFKTKLRYEDIDGEKWKLIFHFSYVTRLVPERVIIVPAGFVTDLASIPRFFHRVLPKSGLHNYAAVIHDYLYTTGEVKDRKRCDRIFLEGMLVRGVSAWKAYAMYWGVRLCGWKAWNEHRRQQCPNV